jgi:GcrA cell cycle regulator
MAWTEDRVETLKKLWSDGLTASQIATALGEVTRNAVIGKAHRLGLSGRPSPVKSDRPRAAKPAKPKAAAASKPTPKPAQKPVQPAVPIIEEDFEDSDPATRQTLLTVTDRMCKWPIGHPGEAGFHFCGRKVQPSLPYCPNHAAKAYQPAQSRREKAEQRRQQLRGAASLRLTGGS